MLAEDCVLNLPIKVNMINIQKLPNVLHDHLKRLVKANHAI